ncbi:3-oxoacyl-[acyl-carrier-protein] reductase [Lachnellula hyalina]|uniref:3-oxoacyl-[acyl-carrier-protein] reductase n=1 Tax=Lachnellula hyalina TaxID=1316788 RepID=A0A8H8R0X4_9HELO|nr:3-oxoacyl-[acyl-carrier-protein] reductase [Lachnellula hyalina]TVY25641.1 3-oxoacyl-[acyl-carrier-protein] reductase [Lachnellula hyalina]
MATFNIIEPGVAFISGAASGIGKATAFAFAKHGVTKLALGDINSSAQAAVSKEIQASFPNVEIETLSLDAGDETSIINAHKQIVERFGRIDYAVNNAGVPGVLRRSTELTTEEFSQAVHVNMTGVWIAQRTQLNQMMKQEPLAPGYLEYSQFNFRLNRGVIVNVASIYGKVCGTEVTSYCTSKFGVIGLTKSDSVDYAPHNIRINAVCPGFIATAMLGEAVNLPQGNLKRFIDGTPMRRFGKSEEIADAIIFLSSNMSAFITGQELSVDGYAGSRTLHKIGIF